MQVASERGGGHLDAEALASQFGHGGLFPEQVWQRRSFRRAVDDRRDELLDGAGLDQLSGAAAPSARRDTDGVPPTGQEGSVGGDDGRYAQLGLGRDIGQSHAVKAQGDRTPTPLVERRKWQKPAVLAAHGRVCGNPASRIIKYIDLHIKPMLLTKTDIVNDKTKVLMEFYFRRRAGTPA
ncbi:MAG: hypothetical protein IPF74_11500 [Rhodocyclaceae bacterium]|nr:hypothetical protein [Rhodocyclaceae bacterium]